ncbi:MAG: FAD-dependent oxidoreductase [Hyphomicrobiales bacterium]|nr:FAD-dependent oxidoreductase [Hyphomicrobiales bacterium]
MMFPNLFKQGTVGNLKAKNRLIMPAMHTNLGSPEDGISPAGIDFYVARARGGFGQIGVGIIDSFQFDHASPGEFLLSNTRHVSIHADLVAQLQAEGALAFAQIGLRRIWALNQMRKQPSLTEFTDEEIRTWIQAVIDTAKRAVDAGYNGIDLLGNGGGAVSIFTSQVFNDRDDEWGGDEDRRLNFALKIVRGIRSAVGDNTPISSRLHGAEFLEGGYGLDVSARNARRLAEAGVDLFNVAAGGHATTVPNLTPNVKESSLAILAHGIRQGGARAKIAASTRITDPFAAEEVLRKGWADYISIARGALADPDWPRKVKAGDWDEIRPCVACNECLDEATVRERTVRCLVNPRAGRHSELAPVSRAEAKKKVIVIGGGCVGLQTSITAAERGHDVHLYEQNPYLGGKWLSSFAPPGREPLRGFLTWLITRAKRTGVNIHLDTEVTPNLLDAEAADEVVVTVGAVPEMPQMPGIDLPHVVTAEQVLMGDATLGKKVVVAGAGGAGVEVAHFIATLHEMDRDLEAHLQAFDGYNAVADAIAGTRREVVLVGRNRRLGIGLGPATRWVLVNELDHDGVNALSGSELMAIGEGVVIVQPSDGGGEMEIAADSVVICTGYRANEDMVAWLRPHASSMRVIGDAKHIDHAMEGIAEAYDVGLAI